MAEQSVVKAHRLYTGDAAEPLEERAIVIAAGRIVRVCPCDEAPTVPVIAEAAIVAPGLFDLQLNGAGGVLFNDQPDLAGLAVIAAGARKGGAAWILPTFITDHGARYSDALTAARVALGEIPGVVGVHLEGPFLSPHRPGIHPVDAIRPLNDEDFTRLSTAGLPLLLTLAPEELPVDRIAELTAAGVRVFAGHTAANFGTMSEAEAAGLCGVTHLFNAMNPLQGREPGVIGATFGSTALFAGIIADGVHVHRANLETALRLLGPDRLFLVTDAMSPLGTALTDFELLGKRIFRTEGRLMDSAGTLAGADISMIEAVRQMDALTGCGLGNAIRMASLTPARAMGLEAEIGSVSVGKRAGLTLLDSALQPEAVLVDGEIFR